MRPSRGTCDGLLEQPIARASGDGISRSQESCTSGRRKTCYATRRRSDAIESGIMFKHDPDGQ
jgi:hypothetical protein